MRRVSSTNDRAASVRPAVFFNVTLAVVLSGSLALFAAGDRTAAAAGDPAAATPAGPGFAKKPRRAQPRTVVEDEILALLPWKGIYAAGGGSSVPAWRVVVTLEGDLRAGSNPRPGSSTTALLDKKRTKLAPEVLSRLVKLADRAWREKPARRPEATDDSFEILVVADGEQVFVLDPKGVISGGAAALLLTELKAQAAGR